MHKQVEPWLEKLTGMEFQFSSIDLTPNYIWELGWAFGAMFFACMLCHGELTRLKPAPRGGSRSFTCSCPPAERWAACS
jgi:hypothetical protein